MKSRHSGLPLWFALALVAGPAWSISPPSGCLGPSGCDSSSATIAAAEQRNEASSARTSRSAAAQRSRASSAQSSRASSAQRNQASSAQSSRASSAQRNQASSAQSSRASSAQSSRASSSRSSSASAAGGRSASSAVARSTGSRSRLRITSSGRLHFVATNVSRGGSPVLLAVSDPAPVVVAPVMVDLAGAGVNQRLEIASVGSLGGVSSARSGGIGLLAANGVPSPAPVLLMVAGVIGLVALRRGRSRPTPAA